MNHYAVSRAQRGRIDVAETIDHLRARARPVHVNQLYRDIINDTTSGIFFSSFPRPKAQKLVRELAATCLRREIINLSSFPLPSFAPGPSPSITFEARLCPGNARVDSTSRKIHASMCIKLRKWTIDCDAVALLLARKRESVGEIANLRPLLTRATCPAKTCCGSMGKKKCIRRYN